MCDSVVVFLTEFTAELRLCFFFLMIRRPPRSTLDRSSAASDVYKRQVAQLTAHAPYLHEQVPISVRDPPARRRARLRSGGWPLIHISEPTRPY